MKENTCLVVDVWEGQLEIDEAVMKTNGVAGMVIRLNDMNGGHHMDTTFVKQWTEAKNFVRFPYFVYNPWVDGAANFTWLKSHMPADATAVALDIEVRYSGITTAVYAREVAKFLNLCRDWWQTIIYTGQWFLPYLSSWPATADYWWAQYPDPVAYFGGVTTWEELKLRLDRLDKPFNQSSVPGRLMMWQVSGDYLQLPGTVRKIDVNVFYGSEEELRLWAGAPKIVPPEPVVPSNTFIGWIKPRYVANGPAIIAASDAPRANHPTIALDQAVQAWIKTINRNDADVWKLFASDNVGPTKGINGNGKLVYIPAAWSGNIVKVIESRSGWLKVESIILNGILPTITHKSMPWLVHRMTTVGERGQFITYPLRPGGQPSAWDSLDDPLLSVNGEFWIPETWVNTNAVLTVGVNIRTGPGTSFPIVGGLQKGTLIQPVNMVEDSSGNRWAMLSVGRWCCMRYRGEMFSDWYLV